jgi:hypothetical protein
MSTDITLESGHFTNEGHTLRNELEDKCQEEMSKISRSGTATTIMTESNVASINKEPCHQQIWQ